MRTKFNIVLNKNKAKTYIQATYTHAKSYMEHVKTLKSEIPDKSEKIGNRTVHWALQWSSHICYCLNLWSYSHLTCLFKCLTLLPPVPLGTDQ